MGVVRLFLLISVFAQKPVAETDPVTLTAKSANVAQPGSPLKIVVFRWSSEEERNRKRRGGEGFVAEVKFHGGKIVAAEVLWDGPFQGADAF